MQRKSMRGSPTSVYLTAMAVADAGTVYAVFLPKVAFPDAETTYDWVCKMNVFFLFGFGDVAVWILAATTVDRFIAVVLPLKAKHLCTVVRSCIVVFLIIVVAIVKNVHLWYTRGISYTPADVNANVTSSAGSNATVSASCWYLPDHSHFETYIRPWIGITFYALIPMGVIFCCNITIIWKLRKMSKIRQTNSKTPGDSGGKIKPNSMTAMLLAISLMFMFMVTPAIGIYVAANFWAKDEHSTAKLIMAFAITDILVGINHSTNFILYVIAGRRFRRELLLMCACRKDLVYPQSMDQSVDG
ncbi:FMRFamide receptor-like [Lineus longissimus]|uniref:FMRFamide receptor-like n=1 Tax=Lineus longissimus TaxID=88925 RepID=UPI00315D46DD